MRILLVSRVWPRDERSGVALCAATHARIILELGHDLAIVGNARLGELGLGVPTRTHLVSSSGGMSLYSPPRVSLTAVRRVVDAEAPDLVITEGWQSALTEAFAWCAARAGRRVLMISHGVSLAPYEPSLVWRLRTLAWSPYEYFWLPYMVKMVSWVTTLDDTSSSERFLDRDLARSAGTPVSVLANTPINWRSDRSPRHMRQMQVLCVGYFSPVKNQLAIIRLAHAFKESGLSFVFVGARRGKYFAKCVAEVRSRGLTASISFSEDSEVSVGDEIARSIAVVSASLTEALPMVLLEAMASGTPFIAPTVGAIPGLRGGLFADSDNERVSLLARLLRDDRTWMKCSEDGVTDFESRFSQACVARSLERAILGAIR